MKSSATETSRSDLEQGGGEEFDEVLRSERTQRDVDAKARQFVRFVVVSWPRHYAHARTRTVSNQHHNSSSSSGGGNRHPPKPTRPPP